MVQIIKLPSQISLQWDHRRMERKEGLYQLPRFSAVGADQLPTLGEHQEVVEMVIMFVLWLY